MQSADLEKLRRNQVLLVRQLYVDDSLLACMKQDRILTDSMIEEIEVKNTKSGKNSELVAILPRRGPNAFAMFVKALVLTSQDHIADALDPALANHWRREGVSLPPYIGGHQPPVQQGHPDPRYSQTAQPSYAQGHHTPMTGGYQDPRYSQTAQSPYGGGYHPPMTGGHQDPRYSQTARVIPQGGDIGGYQTNPMQNRPEEGAIPINIRTVDEIDAQRQLMDTQNVYSMALQGFRGRAIILNNELFYASTKVKLDIRYGSDMDEKYLRSLFSRLGFVTDTWANLTAKEIKVKLHQERNLEDHRMASAFIFAILSHGTRGQIYGTDGDTVSVEDEIMTSFDGRNCKALIHKPKLFFIQACQGDRVTKGVEQHDGPESDAVGSLEKTFEDLRHVDNVDSVPFLPSDVHEKADMLLAYSTVPGYKSWRHVQKGSWFMRDLVETFAECSHRDHVSDMLTMVSNKISQRQAAWTSNVQINETRSTLRKKLYFFPTRTLNFGYP